MTRDQHDYPIVIFVEEDDLLHTEEHPFCSIDPRCPCHEDPERIAAVAEAVAHGELTSQEATLFVSGKLL
ncbi:MAG TPA: hypothetical protein VJ761_18175 [Ktedonobacteraceae bacterium]|nr:hypothetical protein [Ktedonobacteraceae bacterium]